MPDDFWTDLVDAHHRAAHRPLPAAPVHRPRAAVLACSDARVPPSIIFGQPVGSLFVVRIAGNTAGPAALASLDYAVEQLGVGLLVVLGHTDCGAVQAATSSTCSGHLAPIIEPIRRVAGTMAGASLDEVVRNNVANTVDVLTDHGGPVGLAARDGRLDIRGAVHHLVTGRLEPVPRPTNSTLLLPLPLPLALPLEAP